jgi:hypothetical protein
MGQSPYQLKRFNSGFGTRGLTCLNRRCFLRSPLCYPLRFGLNRLLLGATDDRTVIFARDAQYALVTICCQALRAQHIAFLF